MQPSPREHIRVVIDDLRIGLVEFLREQRFGERHADRIRNPLAERAGRRFDARRDAVFGVTRRLRMKLAEMLQLFHRQIVAGQMQQRIQQHRAVAVRQHEAVAIRPVRVLRVMTQMARPQRNADFRHAHRHAGVTGVGLLNGIHRQRTDCVGHQGSGSGRRGRHVESGERVQKARRGRVVRKLGGESAASQPRRAMRRLGAAP